MKPRKPLPPRTKEIARSTKPIARSALKPSSKEIPRGAPPNRQNKARKAREWPRAFHSKARVKFVSRLPCAACGYAGPVPRENAHIESGGASRRADYDKIIPLCRAFTVGDFGGEEAERGALKCHRVQHGVNGGWLAIGMTEESARRAADLTEAAWQEHLSRGGDDA